MISSFRISLIVLILILIFLQYRLWFESNGMQGIKQLKQKIKEQEFENQQLTKRNADLLFQIERMKKSEDATESRARNELGMIKKGEKFYQIVK